MGSADDLAELAEEWAALQWRLDESDAVKAANVVFGRLDAAARLSRETADGRSVLRALMKHADPHVRLIGATHLLWSDPSARDVLVELDRNGPFPANVSAKYTWPSSTMDSFGSAYVPTGDTRDSLPVLAREGSVTSPNVLRVARQLWCWVEDRWARRALFDIADGRLIRTWTVPSGKRQRTRSAMAGHVRLPKLGRPAAAYTTDGRTVIVQRGKCRIDLSNEVVEVERRQNLLWVSVALVSRSSGMRLRFVESRAAQEFRDPMDDGWLGMVERLAHNGGLDGLPGAWDPNAIAEGVDCHRE